MIKSQLKKYLRWAKANGKKPQEYRNLKEYLTELRRLAWYDY